MGGDRGLYARIDELAAKNERLQERVLELERENAELRGIDEGGPAT